MHSLFLLQEYVEYKGLKLSQRKVQEAKKKKGPCEMAKSLIRGFFSHEELITCSVLPSKNGKAERPKPNMTQLDNLLGMQLTHKRLPIYSYLVSSFLIPSCSLLDFVAETYPTRPWTYKDMMQAINKGFIDYRNHPPKGPQN